MSKTVNRSLSHIAPEPYGSNPWQAFGTGRIAAWRYLVILALLLSAISCAGSQSIELSVDGAVLTRDFNGRAAIDVSLSAESSREFGIFTSKIVGRFIEIRFLNEALTTPRLLSPILSGHFQMSASPNRIDGTLNEDNVAEIARKLSSGNAKLEVRLADERK